MTLEAFKIGFQQRCSRVWSWSLILVVMFRRWKVWLKLTCSSLALSRCILMDSLDADVTICIVLGCGFSGVGKGWLRVRSQQFGG